jgi:geranylgeranyl pyrophosphate synthase
LYTDQKLVSIKEISKGIELTNKKLLALGKSDFLDKQLSDAAVHLIRRHGKLIRPGLVFFGALYSGYDIEDVVDLAVSIELLHTSSLIHDDLIDRDLERRGVNTTHLEFGEELAILAGDVLISKAIQTSARYGEEVIRYMSNTAMQMSAGETLDFRYQKSKKIPKLTEYFKISELKSASLIKTSAAIFPFYKKSKTIKELEAFGLNFGLAFQIKDDLNDYLNEGRNNDINKFRPNIISSLISEGNTIEKSIEETKLLNKKYLNTAINSLKNDSDEFSKYFKMAEI